MSSSRDFLIQLAERVIPDDTGDSNKYTAEELMANYHKVIGFLNSQEWDEMTDIVNNRSDMKPHRLYNELMTKLQTLPSYDIVEQRLGYEIAEIFLSAREDIEDSNDIKIYIRNDKQFTKHNLMEIVNMMAIAALNDKEQITSEYKKYKQLKQQENQNRRDRIRDLNTPLINMINDINIWLPYPRDDNIWLTDPRTRDLAPHFLELVKQLKQTMKTKRCLLQYITKKRLSQKNIQDLERNMETISLYLQQQQ